MFKNVLFLNKSTFLKTTCNNVKIKFCFILPHVVVEQKVHEKVILELNNGNTQRVNIRMWESKIFLGNKEHEMGYYFNNWDIIK